MLWQQKLHALWLVTLCVTQWLSCTETAFIHNDVQSKQLLKRSVDNALQISIEFKLDLGSEPLAIFERVALVGDAPQLGSWRLDAALLLQHDDNSNLWHGSVTLSDATMAINYRYLIVSRDSSTGTNHVRRWETHVQPRQIVVNSGQPSNLKRIDVFGYIANDKREIQSGWLHTGRILQFKLFRNPLKINDLHIDERLLVKIQPIDAKTLALIHPSGRAHTEYARLGYGDSQMRTQPEFGVPYEKDDIVIFHTTINSSTDTDVAYLLRIYAVTTSNDLTRLVGYQYVQSTELTNISEGKLLVELISPQWPHIVGSVELQYLKITPLPNAVYDAHTSFVDYWRTNWTSLDVGHRGLGRSLKQLTNAPTIIENTIASMKASAALGADMVEFDVMLTSDLVPIIYHDYVVHKAKTNKQPTSSDDLEDVLIKDIAYDELQSLKTYHIVGNKVVEYAAPNSIPNNDERLFPTFEEFLTQINKSVGFDIEIKWPQLRRTGTYESTQTIDKNLYVDCILDVMQKHGCGRFSFFTSFDADICTLLRYKQNMYPVMFLSSTTGYADPRSDTVLDTVNNAQAFDLAGIVPNAASIKLDPKLVEMAAKQQKRVFLWGDLLADTESIHWFKDQGVTGVIYDRLDLWLPTDKQSAFNGMDLPEFFQLQCPVDYVASPNITFNFY